MNDQFDLTMVLLIFFLAISYLNFLSIRLKHRSGWSNVTCNPLHLFSNSLFQTQEESNKEFQRCVVKLSTDATKKIFQNQADEQQKVITEQTKNIAEYQKFGKKIDEYKNSIADANAGYDTSYKNITDSQKAAKKLNDETQSKVNEFKSKVESIFNNIKSYI